MFEINIQTEINHRMIHIHIQNDQPRIYAIQGNSGIGKTTLLNMIAGIRIPDKGFIRIHHRTLTDTSQRVHIPIQHRRIGYLFQDYQLFPHMTVFKNITFMAQNNAHIERLIDQLNIKHLLTSYPERCSGGEKQRIALARALSMKPDLLLLDEPFSSLDDETKQQGIDLIKEIYQQWQIPIIFVTHSKWEANALADETIVLQ
ncbi:ATP-binding cassette domain-containing protein [Staphylococcus coagulans]|uniref:ATP-binding cassette domain-containing protein n=1 Tax=Staphylococcus coagulans TaxID=74706 RepID=UPI0015FB6AF4|nr:ATP-binding cassette domain-containing protein [Staphylococcus coagulans]MDU9268569.1 ATP-binding cassette domain-containing protein [Staphylococcus coagulans]MDU9280905.1 ATP-binding cassette domain-containing protein [Staphylococcus coagulans]MDU9292951.1 ATP-binding cassette domain-containing protein [Staphylococcus coagulans]MDU9305301.1 ATP-binding cassette domain-containing protein [Staphylococcus coagulans]MDU9322403.1 ATP-binding cassette domain-containing protein [Staphylococcus co